MKTLFRRLASLRLTIWLLLALAVLAALGTFEVIPQGFLRSQYSVRFGLLGDLIVLLGLDRFHTSIPFRGVILLLCANLLACGLGKSLGGIKNAVGTGLPSVEIPSSDKEGASQRLKNLGFKVKDTPEGFAASKNSWAFAAFGLVHLSPVAVILGAFIGSVYGFVGTVNIPLGSIESKVSEWIRMEEIELPFAVQPKTMIRQWYPLRLRLLLKNPDGTQITEVETTEGERFKVGDTGMEAVVDSFSPDHQDISFRVFIGDKELGPFDRKGMEAAPIRVNPLAFKGDVKQIVSELVFFNQKGGEISRKTARVNDPADVLGYRVFITALSFDDQGKPFVGLQVARDPGQWLLWSGALLLSLGVTLLLFAEGAWVRWERGRLTGRSSRNRAKFAKTLEGVAGGKT